MPPLSVAEQVGLIIVADCQTQWRTIAGMSGVGRTGLDYSGVRDVAEAHGVAWDHDLLKAIQMFEIPLLLLFAKESTRKGATDTTAVNDPLELSPAARDGWETA